jgi:hypothetical protein
VALASAWKAHIEFEMSNFAAMATSLRLVQQNVAPGEHEALARMAMVVSNSLMLCGEESESYKWFIKGREYALKDGDQASLEALLYNRATMALGWLRVHACSEEISPDRLQRIRSEVKSARNLQALTGIATMENHVSLMEARLLTMDGRYRDAIDKLQDVREKSPFAEHNFSKALIDLEICYCYAKDGKVDRALAAFVDVNNPDFTSLDTDEQIVALWMRGELCAIDARFGSFEADQLELSRLQAKHKASCTNLKTLLEQFL